MCPIYFYSTQLIFRPCIRSLCARPLQSRAKRRLLSLSSAQCGKTPSSGSSSSSDQRCPRSTPLRRSKRVRKSTPPKVRVSGMNLGEIKAMLMERMHKSASSTCAPPDTEQAGGAACRACEDDSDDDTAELLALVESFEASQQESSHGESFSLHIIDSSEPLPRRTSIVIRGAEAMHLAAEDGPRRSPRKSTPSLLPPSRSDPSQPPRLTVSAKPRTPSRCHGSGGMKDISNTTGRSNRGQSKTRQGESSVVGTQQAGGTFESKRLQAQIRQKKRAAERRRAEKSAARAT